MKPTAIAFPEVVKRDEWREARERLLEKEKALTRSRDALNAERRRLPMVEVEKEYVFEGPEGEASLQDLFDDRRQLIMYHHMLRPADPAPCEGCGMFVDNLPHLSHLRARDTSLVLVSRAPIQDIERFRRRMRWSVPWYSVAETGINADFGAAAGFALNVFLRHGERVFHTYHTAGRGVEYLGTNWSLLDLTPFGRQEEWEDSPEGRPQTPPYAWWRLHDEYENQAGSDG